MPAGADLPPAQLRRAVLLLRRIQWAASIVNLNNGFKTSICPQCGGAFPDTPGVVRDRVRGHVQGCELAALLAELGG